MHALQQLIDLLQVTPSGERQFTGEPGPGEHRIYGGLTITQALDAARQCCPAEYAVQSLHGQFLRPGDHEHKIEISVEELKDGRRFKLYNVYCRQQGNTIFFATVTFHLPETAYEHAMTPPELDLPATDTARFYPHRQHSWSREEMEGHTASLEVRIAEGLEFRKEQLPQSKTWFKLASAPAVSDWQQTLLLAYASDWNMPSIAMRPHTVEKGYMPSLASLDHAIWFYRQPQFEDWIAYVQESPAALNGRGHTRGLFYDQQGELLGAVSQESYLVPKKMPPPKAKN
jgi:acyl-CoA thioesterase-2